MSFFAIFRESLKSLKVKDIRVFYNPYANFYWKKKKQPTFSCNKLIQISAKIEVAFLSNEFSQIFYFINWIVSVETIQRG